MKYTIPCSKSSLKPLTSKYSEVFSCSISHCLSACASSLRASVKVGRCRGSLCHVFAINLYSSGRQFGGISGRTPLGMLRTTSRPDKFGYGVQPAKRIKLLRKLFCNGNSSGTHLMSLFPIRQCQRPKHQSQWRICGAVELPGPSI